MEYLFYGAILVVLWIASMHFAFKRGALYGLCARQHVSPLIIKAEDHQGQILLYDYIDSCFLGQVSAREELNGFLSAKYPDTDILVVGSVNSISVSK